MKCDRLTCSTTHDLFVVRLVFTHTVKTETLCRKHKDILLRAVEKQDVKANFMSATPTNLAPRIHKAARG